MNKLQHPYQWESGAKKNSYFGHIARMDQNRLPYISMHGQVNEQEERQVNDG